MVRDNRVVSVPPESSQSDQQPAERPDDAETTREMPKHALEKSPQSPWSRDYAGPAPTPTYRQWPQEPEERFAGRPYSPPPLAYLPPPSAYAPTTPQGQPEPLGQPEPPADWTFPPASQQGWPAPATQPRDPRRALWTGLTLVSIAIVATLIAVLVSSTTSGSSSSKSSASGGTTLPGPAPSLAPSPAPSASSPSNPQSPLPPLGTVATPPGLLAIDYHAYSLSTLAPSDVALGQPELVQFKKYGLSRVVGLRALTLGPTAASGDDYDADINILQFSNAAGAAAELNYSNTENKKKASTIALPGLPTATAFVNKGDSSTGISIGAFTTVGRYQVVVILSGFSPNVPTNAQVVAAEAAKVMRAVLPDAATIVPTPSSGGSTGPTIPGFPTPTPTGTHA